MTESAAELDAAAPDANEPRVARMSSDGLSFWENDDWGWRPLWISADVVVETASTRFAVPTESAALLTGGCLNQTWLLHCRDRNRVLRVGRPERTVEQVCYEHVLSRAWACHLPQIVTTEADPVVITSVAEQDHVLSLYPFCSGVPGSSVPAERRLDDLASVMATMHRIARELALPQRPGMSAIDDEPVGVLWSAARTAVEDRFGRSRDVTAAVAVVDRAVDEIDHQVQRWRAAGRLESRAAVHGDLNERNQLYRGDRLVGIIDTDDCRVEPLVWEVAGLAYSDPSVSPDAAWEAYLQAGGPLDPRDRELLVTFARLGALTELQWITDETGAATHLGLRNLQAIAENLGGSPVRG